MAFNEINNKEIYENHFNKIILLNTMVTQIGSFGFEQGNDKIFDYIDLNCGGIPEGDYNLVIDENAPEEFLSLYTQIVENRFAFAVTGVLKMNEEFITPIKKYMYSIGQNLEIKNCDSLEQAFGIVNSIVLDGMPFEKTKQVVFMGEERFVWEKEVDTHQKAWEKAGTSLQVYYDLLQEFVKGLLSRTKITFEIENCDSFILKKI